MKEQTDSRLQRLHLAEQMDEGLDFWGMLSRRKWLMVPMLVLGLGLAYAKYTREPAVFESTSTVLVQNSNKDVGVGRMDHNDGKGADMQTQVVTLIEDHVVCTPPCN